MPVSDRAGKVVSQTGGAKAQVKHGLDSRRLRVAGDVPLDSDGGLGFGLFELYPVLL